MTPKTSAADQAIKFEAPAKPPFLSAILELLLRHGFDEKTIRVGITGFGKIKTHLAEIGLVSTKAGFY